jgi:cobalt/nickel transport system permease protein
MTRHRTFFAAVLLLALALAGVVSFYASSSPDGLEKVAEDKGFIGTARHHDLAGSPLAGYGVEGVDNARLSGGLSGIIGVGATLALGSGLFLVLRRRSTGTPATQVPQTTQVPPATQVPQTTPSAGTAD